ncbi:MAG: sodium:alanine symporter family protein [Clostridia bacterium]|nr:sodium:alanine symporter family protein [Clostridia bacterium]
MLIFLENLISGALPFVLLLAGGSFLTVKSGFFQFRCFPKAFRNVFSKQSFQKDENGVSPFGAACTSLSATVGTGNIAGVAAAIALGGAGAVFWLWVSAFTGMCVKSAEILLAVRFRQSRNGRSFGGPMLAIEKGLGRRFVPLAKLFAWAALPAAFFSGAAAQVSAVSAAFGGRKVSLLIGLLFAGICAAVTVGGARKIVCFNEILVPVMAVGYLLLTLTVILSRLQAIPHALHDILIGAFSPAAVTGGAVGSAATAMFTGASRGVFSNEAGLGTSAIAHAAAEGNGKDRSLFGIFEVFVDSFVICTLTALTILCADGKIEYGKPASSELVCAALSKVFGKAAPPLLGGMITLFGLSSVIGWGFYTNVCATYLFGAKGKRWFVRIYPLFCLAGSLLSVGTVWRLSAFFNGVMLCTNLTAILLLRKFPLSEMKKEKTI